MLRFLIGTLAAIVLTLTLPAAGDAQNSYKIRSGDMLQFEVLEDSTLNRTLLVLPDGSISVPLVGSLRAAGRTLEDVRSSVTAGLARNFAAAPTVFISVGELAQRTTRTRSDPVTHPVFLMGEVANPGRIEVEHGTTLLQAIATGGGLTRFGAPKRIQLHRDDSTGKQVVYRIDYQAALSGVSRQSVVLQPGDVIVVPARRLFE